MDIINTDFKKHHAYLILSSSVETPDKLKEFLRKSLEFEPEGNPDYWEKDVETFGIEDSRHLKEIDAIRPFRENGWKVVVVKTEFITSEAQHALLKVLEDPNSNSSFFFLLPSKEDILPTLLSRFLVLGENSKGAERGKISIDPKLFLGSGVVGRLQMVSKIVTSKNKREAQQFTDSLEVHFLNQNDWRYSDKNLEVFELLNQSRSFLKTPSASLKMILENLCFNLPES